MRPLQRRLVVHGEDQERIAIVGKRTGHAHEALCAPALPPLAMIRAGGQPFRIPVERQFDQVDRIPPSSGQSTA